MTRKSRGKVDMLEVGFADKLKAMNAEELLDLLDNHRKIDQLVADHPLYRGLKEKRNEMIAENRNVAEYTAGREDALLAALDQLTRSQNRLVEKKSEFEREKRTYGESREKNALGWGKVFDGVRFCRMKITEATR